MPTLDKPIWATKIRSALSVSAQFRVKQHFAH